jgi:hypothetical protein
MAVKSFFFSFSFNCWRATRNKSVLWNKCSVHMLFFTGTDGSVKSSSVNSACGLALPSQPPPPPYVTHLGSGRVIPLSFDF